MRDQITTWMDLAGLVLLAVAGGVFVARWSLAGGLATSGALLLVSSALIVARATPKKPKPEETTA